MKKNKVFVLTILIFLVQISFSSAWGVSSVYSDNHPYVLAPGERGEATLWLQNVAPEDEGKDVLLRVKYAGDGVGRLNGDKDYPIVWGWKDVGVPIEINIPFSAVGGEKYNVGVVVSEIKEGEGGMIDVAVELSYSFPVVVAGEKVDTGLSPENSFGGWWIFLVGGIVVVGGAVYLVLRRRRTL